MKFELNMPMPSKEHMDDCIASMERLNSSNNTSPFQIEQGEGNRLVAIIDLQLSRYMRKLSPFNMSDIKDCVQPFLDIPGMPAEQIIVKNIALHYNIVTKHSPRQYLDVYMLWPRNADTVSIQWLPIENLQILNIESTITEEDVKDYSFAKKRNVLQLKYNLLDAVQKLGYEITATHMLDTEFMRQIIDVSVQYIMRLEYFSGYNLYEQTDSEMEARFSYLQTNNQVLISEIAEKLLAKAYQKRLTLDYHLRDLLLLEQ